MGNSSGKNTTLIGHYRDLIDDGTIIADPDQRLVAETLNLLAKRLDRTPTSVDKGGFARALFGWGRERINHEELRGLYIYGSVGRGKSMLMQLFVNQIGDKAYRVHFHEFMQWVHRELAVQRQLKVQDPIQEVAKKVASRSRVLCLDEMQIENIADAMIIGRLFKLIFEKGVLLVTTSNRHPNTLYKDGLNRHRFLPFIALIEANCDIIDLAGSEDYRFKNSALLDHYFINDPLGFDLEWQNKASGGSLFVLDISGRKWELDGFKKPYGRTSFAEACEQPRGAADYSVLVDHVKVLFISNIPILETSKTSAITRFVTLVDILYEAGAKLCLDLPVALDQLHQDQKTSFVFDRTISRLVEMAN